MASLKKFMSSRGFDALKMQTTSTDHLAIDAVLNTVAGRFIVDTGASNTCLDLGRAGAFGLTTEPSEILAAGAGATDMETFISDGNTLMLGNWQQTGVRVVLLDLSHVNQALIQHEAEPVDGILGADVLRMARAVIDYRKNRLYLK